MPSENTKISKMKTGGKRERNDGTWKEANPSKRTQGTNGEKDEKKIVQALRVLIFHQFSLSFTSLFNLMIMKYSKWHVVFVFFRARVLVENVCCVDRSLSLCREKSTTSRFIFPSFCVCVHSIAAHKFATPTFACTHIRLSQSHARTLRYFFIFAFFFHCFPSLNLALPATRGVCAHTLFFSYVFRFASFLSINTLIYIDDPKYFILLRLLQLTHPMSAEWFRWMAVLDWLLVSCARVASHPARPHARSFRTHYIHSLCTYSCTQTILRKGW